MKYLEQYLEEALGLRALGRITTEEDTRDGLSGLEVSVDGLSGGLFISYEDYSGWLEKKYTLKNTPAEYVDLGLPSGNLWATHNLGATKTGDPGLYFQWGAMIGFSQGGLGTWKTTPFNGGSEGCYVKHETFVLDVVKEATNGLACMPGKEDFEELVHGTKQTPILLQGGIWGRQFISKKNPEKSISFPLFENKDCDMYLWSSSCSDYSRYASCLKIGSGSEKTKTTIMERYYKFPVRGIIRKK